MLLEWDELRSSVEVGHGDILLVVPVHRIEKKWMDRPGPRHREIAREHALTVSGRVHRVFPVRVVVFVGFDRMLSFVLDS